MELFWQRGRFTWIASKTSISDINGKFEVVTAVPQNIDSLCRCLLELGGAEVCVPFTERDSSYLFREGKLMPIKNLSFQLGEEGECHSNSADLWRQNKKNMDMATGYALTEEDNMWRQHSWVSHKAGYLIETTEPRIMYFGVVLRGIRRYIFLRIYK